MQPQLWISLFFLISFSAYFSSFFLLKKNDKNINAVLWLPLNLVLSYGVIAFVCAIVNFILPINLLTVSVICLVLAGALWYLIYKKGKQKYYFKVCDLIAFVVFIAIAVFYSYKQFGADLMPIYETSDPSVHLQMAINILQNQELHTMFFAPLLNALFIEFFGIFISEVAYFKLFILTDIAMFAISGIVIYSCMALWAKNTKYKLCAIFLSVAYMLGYPLNNMVFGFVYLGISVTLIVVLVAFVRCYLNDEFNHLFTVFSLMILCFSIALCYSLFAPPVFFALLFVSAIKFGRHKKLFTLKFIFEQLKIFLLPCALFLWYVLISKSAHSVSALSVDGYIYKDLYSNFFLLIPPAIFAIYRTIKKKEFGFAQMLLVILLIMMAGVLVLGLKGVFSAYYYYKLYYPLWAVCIYLTYIAIDELGEQNLSFVATSFACLVTAFIIAVSGIDVTIQNINVQFNPSSGAYRLFNIYQFNESKIIKTDNAERRDEWHKKLELYYYVKKNELDKNGQVHIAADWMQTYWYEGITCQPIDIYYWQNPALAIQTIKESDYVVVLYNSDMYNENKEYFESLEILLENSIGFVARA